MSISPYFKHISSKPEQDLVTELAREVIYLRGMDLIYIPRDNPNIDYLFGEDNDSVFQEGVVLEMYPMEMEGFGGDGDIMSKFGLDIRDEVTIQIAPKRFSSVVTRKYPEIVRPREGDLIAYSLAKALFEITYVEHEKPFYTRGVQTVWELQCKRFIYNRDELQTGIDDIDNIATTPPVDDNTDIQTESDTFVNFDESDPFSSNSY